MLKTLVLLSLLTLGYSVAGGQEPLQAQVLDRRGTETLLLSTTKTFRVPAYALFLKATTERRQLINPASMFPQYIRSLTVGATFGRANTVYAVVRHFAVARTEDTLYRIDLPFGIPKRLAVLSHWKLSGVIIGSVKYNAEMDTLSFTALTPGDPEPITRKFTLGPLSAPHWNAQTSS